MAPQVQAYRPYNDYLLELVSRIQANGMNGRLRGELTFALNGQSSIALKLLVPLPERKQSGTYFSGTNLSSRLVLRFKNELQKGATVFDPACGSGDLLIAAARHLPIEATLQKTLRLWGDLVQGSDISSELLGATKLRLYLLAASRVGISRVTPNLNSIFPLFYCRDFLRTRFRMPSSNIILLNPPFTHQIAPTSCEWSSGRVSSAALFFEKAVRDSDLGTFVSGILPDVLRAGTRYDKWRNQVRSLAGISKPIIVGRFNLEADVDVHFLHAKRHEEHESVRRIRPSSEATPRAKARGFGPSACSARRHIATAAPSHAKLRLRSANFVGSATSGHSSPGLKAWGFLADFRKSVSDSKKVVGDCFKVSVGAVVPFRHKEVGPRRIYLTASDSPNWKRLENIPTRRRFAGTTVLPPFVALKRTSSPSDKCRLGATIITTNSPVALENHLISLKPNDGTIKMCNELLTLLKKKSTVSWLNEQIRCRHLTTSVIKRIPWEK